MKFRPYKSADAQTILSWVKDEETFRRWVTDRYPHYPISPAEMNEKYFVCNGDCPEPDNFYPMTAWDDTGLLGHMILRFTALFLRILFFTLVIIRSVKHKNHICVLLD